MNIIKQTRVLRIEATADDWALYHERGRNRVAKALNAGMKRIINQRDQTYAEMCQKINGLLGAYWDWGAADTEGYDMAAAILRDVYGKEVL